MFTDLESQIENYLDLEKDAEKQLFQEVYNQAIQTEKVLKATRQLPFGIDSNREFFYEAISSNAPEKWTDFLAEEIQLLFNAASAGDEGAIEDLGCMTYLLDFEGGERHFYENTAQFLLSKLNDKLPIIRKTAIESIVSCMDYGGFQLQTIDMMKLQAMLKDKDWNVRKWTYMELRDLNLLPSDYKMSFMDKLRMKL